jgi:hypothetical protein
MFQKCVQFQNSVMAVCDLFFNFKVMNPKLKKKLETNAQVHVSALLPEFSVVPSVSSVGAELQQCEFVVGSIDTIFL